MLHYSDITNKPYGFGYLQSYKDKGFNIKFSLPIYGDKAFGIGFNDIAGTGYYSSEYLVFTDNINRLEYSIGVGWGNYNQGILFTNPLISINKEFKDRSYVLKDLGGSFDPNNYFSGKNMSIFGAAKYQINDKSNIIFEHDPTKAPGNVGYPKKSSAFNMGYEYKNDEWAIKSIVTAAGRFEVAINYSINYQNFSTFPSKHIEVAKSYKDLQRVLELNQIGLKKIKQNKDSILINVRTNTYTNQYEPNQLILSSARDIFKDAKKIEIQHDIHDMEVLRAYYWKVSF